ncbi:MAG: carboxypeptidase M32, partial [Planctomycetales bacterium]|nr:carboxypeptidase M32 [Planctomycetales bacterium]
MADSAATTFDKLCAYARETALFDSINGLLGWDERTKMPPAAGEYRAAQMTHVAGIVHRRNTDPVLGGWLEELAASPLADDPHSDAGATIRVMRRDYEKRRKVPATLVEEITRCSILGQQKWVEARKANDFASFAPLLARIIQLRRQEADAVGYEATPYDALLDDYEPGETTANVARTLEELRQALVPLVAAIVDSGRRPNRALLTQHFAAGPQEALGKTAAQWIGFDFQRGRLDETHHPFCGGAGPHDVRITTRYHEDFFSSSFYSILHEAGHGIYEQGLRPEWFGLPPGGAVSLGIHESQSRMWENLVGRSSAFWQFFLPAAQEHFPAALGGASLDDVYFAVNDVQPSLIRVEADEATYNLHIIIRFELEQALIAGDLPVADLPGAWREKYEASLGVASPTDADGALQDVHWSAALFGYFPTYSLGN